MTAVMTYDSLTVQLIDWAQRVNDTRLAAQIPNIIAQTEILLSREVKGLGFQQTVSGVFIAGKSFISKPARWRETINMNYGTGTGNQVRNIIWPRRYDYCRVYWPNPTLTGAPKYYADWTWDYMLIVPTPALAYPFEMLYYERIQPLDANNSTNWLTANAPDLMFKACKRWADVYIRDNAGATATQADLDRAIMTTLGEDVRRILDATQDAKEGT